MSEEEKAKYSVVYYAMDLDAPKKILTRKKELPLLAALEK